MAPNRPPLPSWTQEPLIPIYWPLVSLEVSWGFPADGTPTMVSYKVHGRAGVTQLLAAGIEWVQNAHDPAQCSEVQADLIKTALGHLTPF